MQLFNLLAVATLAAATTACEMKIQVHYNATYDNKSGFDSSQTNSLCLNTLSQYQLKRDASFHETYYPWPYVGGYAPIKEGDSSSCFNCYKLEYGGRSILFRAINSAKDGVDLGIDLFEELSGGKAAEVKHFNATLSMLGASTLCDLKEQTVPITKSHLAHIAIFFQPQGRQQ